MPLALVSDTLRIPIYLSRVFINTNPAFLRGSCWSQIRDSNPGPLLYESIALPTELIWPESSDLRRRVCRVLTLIPPVFVFRTLVVVLSSQARFQGPVRTKQSFVLDPRNRAKLGMERVTGIEPVSSAWEALIIATIRYPHVVYRL